jgi:hypothetical protein
LAAVRQLRATNWRPLGIGRQIISDEVIVKGQKYDPFARVSFKQRGVHNCANSYVLKDKGVRACLGTPFLTSVLA